MPEKRLLLVGIVDIAAHVVAISMVVYHMVYARFLVQSNIGHDNTHLAFALLVTFLVPLQRNRELWPLTLALIVLTVASTGYVQCFMNDLMARQGLIKPPFELAIGAKYTHQ